jgi:hypothetical protein
MVLVSESLIEIIKMQKIPTIFQRSKADRRYITSGVTKGCEWVLNGEGVATRKYDGVCILIRQAEEGVRAFARREVKPGKEPPIDFEPIAYDEETGKTFGWEPAEQSGFNRWIQEALVMNQKIAEGTYELCGPRINGNPEGYESHILVPHANAQIFFDVPRDFVGLRGYLTDPNFKYEGIVFHHTDGRRAKIKRRDFHI